MELSYGVLCPPKRRMAWLMRALCCAVQYPMAIEMLQEGKIDVKPMITHRFGFTPEDVAAAFDCAARSAETRAIKVMFNLPAEA